MEHGGKTRLCLFLLLFFPFQAFAQEKWIIPEICLDRAHESKILIPHVEKKEFSRRLERNYTKGRVYNFVTIRDDFFESLNLLKTEILGEPNSPRNPLQTHLLRCHQDEKQCVGFFLRPNPLYLKLYCDQIIREKTLTDAFDHRPQDEAWIQTWVHKYFNRFVGFLENSKVPFAIHTVLRQIKMDFDVYQQTIPTNILPSYQNKSFQDMLFEIDQCTLDKVHPSFRVASQKIKTGVLSASRSALSVRYNPSQAELQVISGPPRPSIPGGPWITNKAKLTLFELTHLFKGTLKEKYILNGAEIIRLEMLKKSQSEAKQIISDDKRFETFAIKTLCKTSFEFCRFHQALVLKASQHARERLTRIQDDPTYFAKQGSLLPKRHVFDETTLNQLNAHILNVNQYCKNNYKLKSRIDDESYLMQKEFFNKLKVFESDPSVLTLKNEPAFYTIFNYDPKRMHKACFSKGYAFEKTLGHTDMYNVRVKYRDPILKITINDLKALESNLFKRLYKSQTEIQDHLLHLPNEAHMNEILKDNTRFQLEAFLSYLIRNPRASSAKYTCDLLKEANVQKMSSQSLVNAMLWAPLILAGSTMSVSSAIPMDAFVSSASLGTSLSFTVLNLNNFINERNDLSLALLNQSLNQNDVTRDFNDIDKDINMNLALSVPEAVLLFPELKKTLRLIPYVSSKDYRTNYKVASWALDNLERKYPKQFEEIYKSPVMKEAMRHSFSNSNLSLQERSQLVDLFELQLKEEKGYAFALKQWPSEMMKRPLFDPIKALKKGTDFVIEKGWEGSKAVLTMFQPIRKMRVNMWLKRLKKMNYSPMEEERIIYKLNLLKNNNMFNNDFIEEMVKSFERHHRGKPFNFIKKEINKEGREIYVRNIHLHAKRHVHDYISNTELALKKKYYNEHQIKEITTYLRDVLNGHLLTSDQINLLFKHLNNKLILSVKECKGLKSVLRHATSENINLKQSDLTYIKGIARYSYPKRVSHALEHIVEYLEIEKYLRLKRDVRLYEYLRERKLSKDELEQVYDMLRIGDDDDLHLWTEKSYRLKKNKINNEANRVSNYENNFYFKNYIVRLENDSNEFFMKIEKLNKNMTTQNFAKDFRSVYIQTKVKNKIKYECEHPNSNSKKQTNLIYDSFTQYVSMGSNMYGFLSTNIDDYELKELLARVSFEIFFPFIGNYFGNKYFLSAGTSYWYKTYGSWLKFGLHYTVADALAYGSFASFLDPTDELYLYMEKIAMQNDKPADALSKLLDRYPKLKQSVLDKLDEFEHYTNEVTQNGLGDPSKINLLYEDALRRGFIEKVRYDPYIKEQMRDQAARLMYEASYQNEPYDADSMWRFLNDLPQIRSATRLNINPVVAESLDRFLFYTGTELMFDMHSRYFRNYLTYYVLCHGRYAPMGLTGMHALIAYGVIKILNDQLKYHLREPMTGR